MNQDSSKSSKDIVYESLDNPEPNTETPEKKVVTAKDTTSTPYKNSQNLQKYLLNAQNNF